MTIVTVDSSSEHLHLESIPLVDLRFFSQSELNSLSLCSDESFDLNRCDDVVIPKIDRSVFNESAGSRKQTYSRLRLAPRKPEITSIGRRRRCTGLLPVPKPPSNSNDDPETKENKRIVSLLQDLFARDNNLISINRGNDESTSLDLKNRVALEESPILVVGDGGSMGKKRGRKRKDASGYENGSNVGNRGMEIVNRNGVVVDIAALGNIEDPFGPELKRRTVGLESESDLLGFLRDLEGQWGSRRKKRKIVDAGDFGDVLPIGWKLLLSLKRKEGRFWLNCRRYISPNGQQFVSCKDVSSFLLSIFGPQDESYPNSRQGDENNHAAYNVASGSTAGFTPDLIYYNESPVASLSSEHDNQVALLGSENLADVEIKDLLECHKCKMSFDEKDAYLEHLLLLHQRSSKKHRIGTSIGDGVIIKDGKYECQFCHKIFHERHRYNGHVGIHVKNYVRSLEPSSGKIAMQNNVVPLSASGVPLGVSKVTSVDMDKGCSSQLTSTAKPDDEINIGSPHVKPEVGSTPETSTAPLEDEMDVGSPHVNPEVGFIPETSNAKSNYEVNVGSPYGAEPIDDLNVGSPHIKLSVGSSPETSTAKSNYELNVGSLHGNQDTGANKIDRTLADHSHDKQDNCFEMTDDKVGKIDEANDNADNELNSCSDSATECSDNEENNTFETYEGNYVLTSTTGEIDNPCPEQESGSDSFSLDLSGNEKINGVETVVSEVFSISAKPTEPNEVEESENNEPEIGFCKSQAGSDEDVELVTIGTTDEVTIMQSMVDDTSSPLVQSSDCFPTLNLISDKGMGENDFCSNNQKLENMSDFDVMSLNHMEPSKFGFVTGQESNSLPGESMDLTYDVDLEQALDTSVQFEWETILPKMDISQQQLSTVCVWCGISFNHEAITPEMQSDSVGYMCPGCKAKISGQLNVLDDGLSINFDKL